MPELEAGQQLKCGCVVGQYWCTPHDIYAVRKESDRTWKYGRDGGFVWHTLKPNYQTYLADRDRLASQRTADDYDDRDDHEGGCSCHISPPCAWCVNGGEEDSDT